MPKGIRREKSVRLNERLMQINETLEKISRKAKELQIEKKRIEKELQTCEKESVNTIINNSGLNPEELLDMINSYKKNQISA